MKNGLQITKASAGSGKTYTLVGKYLELAVGDPTDFDSILAITFTNKAAGEMKRKIINEICNLHASYQDSPYANILEQSLDKDPEEISRRISILYNNVIHNSYKIQIKTIDSLLQSILRGLTREIGIAGHYNLETNTDIVKDWLKGKFYEIIDRDFSLLEWTEELMDQEQQQEKSWDFSRSLEPYLNTLFSETARELFRNRWPDVDYTRQLKKIIDREIIKINQEWLSLYHGIIDTETNTTPNFEEYINKKTAIYKITEFILNSKSNNKKLVLNEKQINSILYEDYLSSVKKNFSKKIEKCSTGEKLARFYLCVRKNLPRFLTLNLIKNEIYQFGLLHTFHDLLNKWRQQQHTLLIQDAPYILGEMLQSGDNSFIFEKTSQKIKHILIDEFQDTSYAQWRTLAPLMEEILDNACTVYAVGDPKQSIYAWRGAEVSIMQNELPALANKKGIKPIENWLTTNFRSAPNIVIFNNCIFNIITNNISEILKFLKLDIQNKNLIEYIQLIESSYFNLQQNPSKKDYYDKGKIDLIFFEEKSCLIGSESPFPGLNQEMLEIQTDEGTYNHKNQLEVKEISSKTLKELGNTETTEAGIVDSFSYILESQINKYLKEGFNPGQIAILVRTNKEVSELVDILNQLCKAQRIQYQNAFAIGIDQIHPSRSDAVDYLIACLLYFVFPKEKYILSYIYYSYHKMINEKNSNLFEDLLNDEKIKKWVADKIKNFRGRLSTIVEQLIESLKESTIIYEKHKFYLNQFMDYVIEYESKFPSSIRGFLDWWNTVAIHYRKNIQPDKKEIFKVATIHSVKGLEFPCVIVGLLKKDILRNSLQEKSWYYVEDQSLNNLGFFYLNNSRGNHFGNLTESEFFKNQIKRFSEELNLLYVACTRAQLRLALIFNNTNSKYSCSWGSIINYLFESKINDSKSELVQLMNNNIIKIIRM